MKHSTIAMVGKQERVPCASSLSILARLLPGVCIAIGMTLFFWPNTGEPKAVPSQAVNHLASSSARTQPIETLCVGDRVLAHNPEVSQSERDTFVEPDWTEWLHLSLAMPKADGSLLEIELLRPESWVREQMGLVVDRSSQKSPRSKSSLRSCSLRTQTSTQALLRSPRPRRERLKMLASEIRRQDVDSVPYSPLLPILRDIAFADAELQLSGEELQAIFVEMDLPELAITGEAIVLDIRGPPTIRPGAGRVVTATFHHSSGDVIDLVVGDLSGEALASGFSDTPTIAASNGHASDYRSQATDTIGTTSNHPFWSVDRQAYVQAGQLRIGERLHTYSGDTKRVISKLARPGPQPVYNLEVFAEHVYYVGQDGLLVHNTYVAPKGAIGEALEQGAIRRTSLQRAGASKFLMTICFLRS